MEKELSDQENVNSQHNPTYDHEAVLGEEAKTFELLSPEESIRRLGLIVDKIDKNNDTLVTKEELKDWIKCTQRRYQRNDVERQWRMYNPNETESIHWKTYYDMRYGFLDTKDFVAPSPKDANYAYITMQKKDRRRWSTASQDGDDALTIDEFAVFLHPEEVDYMKDVVVMEIMEALDKDGDEKISLAEYIGDMYKTDEGEVELPEWVKNEQEQFKLYRDKDGNGFMEYEELKKWMLPDGYDHAEAEARHLIYEADSNADQKLTKDEILEKYDIFVGSQATDFGEALARHDEL